MPLGDGRAPKLEPITEAGSGSVQEKEKAYLAEIIEKVNDLFEGELTDQDKLVYVNNVIKGKLLESETLRQQAAQQHEGAVRQFARSEDRAAQRDHRRAGRAHRDEHAGAQLARRAARHEGHPAEPRGAV